jgi:hypothetical protein
MSGCSLVATLSSYRRGEQHSYRGGLATKSPVRIGVPSGGRWHLVVDMQGLSGTTRSSVRVIPGPALRPLPPLRESRVALQGIAENFAAIDQEGDAPTSGDGYDVLLAA